MDNGLPRAMPVKAQAKAMSVANCIVVIWFGLVVWVFVRKYPGTLKIGRLTGRLKLEETEGLEVWKCGSVCCGLLYFKCQWMMSYIPL